MIVLFCSSVDPFLGLSFMDGFCLLLLPLFLGWIRFNNNLFRRKIGREVDVRALNKFLCYVLPVWHFNLGIFVLDCFEDPGSTL
jgi:hypothetical protein